MAGFQCDLAMKLYHLQQRSYNFSLLNCLQIRGFPSIKIFQKGEREPTDYEGGRTKDDIVSYAMDFHSANVPPPEVLEVSLFESWLATRTKDISINQ